MVKRNGRDNRICPACRETIGYVRPISFLRYQFTPAPGLKVRYFSDRSFEVVCTCGKAIKINLVDRVL